jgi:hypothetical protein
VIAIAGGGKGEGDEQAERQGEDDPRRGRHAERRHRHEERCRVQAAADHRPADLTEGDVGRRHRCRQHGVVEALVLELEEDVHRRFVDRPVHRRGGEQGGGDELGVVDRHPADGDVADQFADPDADRQQVEERLEEAAEHHQPRAPVDHRAALDHPLRTAQLEGGGRDDAQPGGDRRRRHFSNLVVNVRRQTA